MSKIKENEIVKSQNGKFTYKHNGKVWEVSKDGEVTTSKNFPYDVRVDMAQKVINKLVSECAEKKMDEHQINERLSMLMMHLVSKSVMEFSNQKRLTANQFLNKHGYKQQQKILKR